MPWGRGKADRQFHVRMMTHNQGKGGIMGTSIHLGCRWIVVNHIIFLMTIIILGFAVFFFDVRGLAAKAPNRFQRRAHRVKLR